MSFRMTVDEVFVIKRRGVVATGRVDSGVVRVGDTVHINGGPGVTVDAIEQFRKHRDEAGVGETIGVLFKNIDRSDIDRGAVLTGSGSDAAPFIV
ncbi:MAG TPA: EF-Tu/IF-2/RF-3 family GTPase [Mycobacterium sp.]|nr:EF-Tu/IF-2/RF-3 family GTPase [Mycobacterium sp.]